MIKLKFNSLLIIIGLVVLFKKLNAQNEIDCPKIKTQWYSHKYQYTDELLKLTLPKTVDTICPKSTCCDNSMKTEIIQVSQLKLKSIAELHMKSIIEFLYNNSKDLNDYFQNNLDLSKNQLNQMFINTYSSNYKANRPFFFEFYEKLKQYMVGKEQNIEKILETFFHDMAEKILKMMVLAKKDPETIRCLTNSFLKLNPYQNTDKLIIGHFKSAYPVARMLVNSMKAAHDVFVELSEKLMPSSECATEYATAFYCSWCSITKIMPCEGLCKSVIGKCFGSLNSKEMNKLNKAWKALLMALDKISKKLKHPFNYSEINKNLHVKISDAIMSVHNFFPTVRERIWKNCKIHLTRERRSEDGNDIQNFESLPKSSENIQLKSLELSEIIDKFSTKMQDVTQHFQKYKNIICSSKLKLPKSGNKCWNGIETTSVYKPESKGKSLNKNLPISPLVKASISKLNKIKVTLNNLMDNKNSDPNTFEIKFVEKPKNTEIPRSRPSRISEQIGEGSGSGVDVENTNIKSKPELPSTTDNNNKPIETFEGSGNKSPGNQNAKSRPEFPELSANNVNTPKPEKSIKPTTNTDDEDGPTDQNENEKEKIQKPFDSKKPQIEGSGPMDTFEKSTEIPKIFTTVTTTSKPIPITEPKKNLKDDRFDEESSLPEGSGQEKPPPNSKISSVPDTTTATIVEDVTTQRVLLPNDLPGEIPSEIWIPRVVDYDSRGQFINNPHSTALNAKLYVTVLYSAVFFSVAVVHKFM